MRRGFAAQVERKWKTGKLEKYIGMIRTASYESNSRTCFAYQPRLGTTAAEGCAGHVPEPWQALESYLVA